jgi:hypothetical protein
MLPEAKGEAGEVERSGDLPSVNGAESKKRPYYDPTDIEYKKRRAKEARNEADIARVKNREALTNVVGFISRKGLGRQINDKFERKLAAKIRLYGGDALDALHDLALMPITDNCQQNQIKYLACCRLASTTLPEEGTSGKAVFNDILIEMNRAYQAAAPRIRAVRERVVEFEQPGVIIEASASSPE